MFGKFLVIVVLTVLAVGVVARASHGSGRAQVVVVKPGDTLWSIAAAHYGGDPREGVWKLEHANRVGDAAALRPGEKLVLP